jgi:hypothetical protein
MISTVSHTLRRIALRRPTCGSDAQALALGAPTRCGEPVRASWLGGAGSLVGTFTPEAMFSGLLSGLLSTLSGLSGKRSPMRPSVHPSLTLAPAKLLNDLGKAVMNDVADLYGGNQPSYQLGMSIQERGLGQTSIRRTIQSGQRREILALS